MSLVDQLSALVAPIVAAMGVELVDIEHAGATVRVLVDSPGGISLDRVAEVTHAVSKALDAADPLPSRYTLEVSSPGVERALREPRHFQGAVGEQVSMRVSDAGATRRLSGVVVGASERGVDLRLLSGDGVAGESVGTVAHLEYAHIERARTVFEWGPGPKPGRGSKPGRGHKQGDKAGSQPRGGKPNPSAGGDAGNGRGGAQGGRGRASQAGAGASSVGGPGGDGDGGTDVPTTTAGQP